MCFASWLQSLPQRLTPPPFRLVQIGLSFWQARALHAAAQLDLATILGDATLTATELAERTNTNPDFLARLMRFLVSLDIFTFSNNTYQNNKTSAYLRQDHPNSIRAMILMHNSAPMSQPWYEQLEAGVQQGVPPFVLSHGTDLFGSSHLRV